MHFIEQCSNRSYKDCWCFVFASAVAILLVFFLYWGPEWCLSYKTCHLQFAFCWGLLCVHTRQLAGVLTPQSRALPALANQYSADSAAHCRAIDYLWKVTPPVWVSFFSPFPLPPFPKALMRTEYWDGNEVPFQDLNSLSSAVKRALGK